MFYYLIGIKMLEIKLEISKLENILDDLFVEIDNYKNLFDKGIIDSLNVMGLYEKIYEILDKIKYEDPKQKSLLISGTKTQG